MASWTSVRQLASSVARLTPADRRSALRAFWWLCASAVAIRAARYDKLRGLIDRLPARHRTFLRPSADDYGRAIARAARVVPGATCLAQALAAACLLRRDGLASTLTIGVAVGATGSFEAHAWLEAADARVTGAQHSELHVIIRDSIAARP